MLMLENKWQNSDSYFSKSYCAKTDSQGEIFALIRAASNENLSGSYGSIIKHKICDDQIQFSVLTARTKTKQSPEYLVIKRSNKITIPN